MHQLVKSLQGDILSDSEVLHVFTVNNRLIEAWTSVMKPIQALVHLPHSSLRGPDWLTGGDFGVEASVVGLLILGAVGLLLIRAVVRRGAILAPYWRPEPRPSGARVD